MFSIVMYLTLGIVLFVLLLLQWNSCVKVISKQKYKLPSKYKVLNRDVKNIHVMDFDDDEYDIWFNENE